MATLAERRTDAQARSTKLYLERQRVEATRQQLAQQAQMIDLELVKLDGTIETLDALIAAEPT